MNNMAENIVNLIKKVETEDVIFIEGKAFLIKVAEPNDLARVSKGIICMD